MNIFIHHERMVGLAEIKEGENADNKRTNSDVT